MREKPETPADRQDRSLSSPSRRPQRTDGRDYGGIRSPGKGGQGSRLGSEQSAPVAHCRGEWDCQKQSLDSLFGSRTEVHISSSAPWGGFWTADISQQRSQRLCGLLWD